MEVKDYPTKLSELEAQRDHWQTEREQAATYLAHLQSTAARALLEGNTSHREALASARIAVNEADQVLAEIQRQLPAAKAVDLQEQARKLRAEAGKRRAEAEGIEAEIAPHLDAIQAAQGCRYVPPPPQSRFGWTPAKSEELRQRAGRMEDQADYLEGIAEEVLRKAEEPKRKVVLAGWQV